MRTYHQIETECDEAGEEYTELCKAARKANSIPELHARVAEVARIEILKEAANNKWSVLWDELHNHPEYGKPQPINH